MNYRETPPSPRLAGLVKCFWSLEYQKTAADEPEPVVPDGCIEIVFNLSDRFRRYHTCGEVEMQPSSLVAGQMQRSILISPSGNVRLFGIRFAAAGAFPFFHFDLSDLANRIEPLDMVWGTSASIIEERLSAADGFTERVAVAETFLAGRLSGTSAIDPWLRHAVKAISLASGMKPIRTLARDVGISERGLERRFRRLVGLTPKTFSRVVRFQRILRKLKSSAKPDILQTALAFGYYDQSHLINDFRQFSGSGPEVFLEKAHRITGLFTAAE